MMNQIRVEIKKGETSLEELKMTVEGDSMEDLLSSLRTAKEDTNCFLTTLVNKEKNVQSRKHVEIESSDEDPNDKTEALKKQKI